MDVFKKETTYLGDASTEITLHIVDQMAHECYTHLMPTTLKRSAGFILCFSIENRKSYNNCKKWIDLIAENSCYKNNLVLVGTKSDLYYMR